MNTGQQLGPERSSRIVGVFVLTIMLSFLLDGGTAHSSERNLSKQSPDKTFTSSSSSRLVPPKTFSNDRLQLEGMLRLGSQYLTDETDEGANATFGFAAKFNYKFVDWLKLRSETRLTFSQERFQSQIDDDRFSDGFSMKEAVAVVEPNRYLEFGAGAVNQNYFISSPLLMSNRSFPGLYQQLQYTQGRNYVALRLGQSVPTSRSFDANRQEKEKNPYYYTAGLRGRAIIGKHFGIEPYVTHYRYENLPSVVAFRSAIRGNTVPDPQPTNSRFAFDFAGVLGGLKTEIRPNRRISLVGEYQYIRNGEAPETFNTGQWLGASVRTRYNQMVFAPGVATFYNESDTSPAFYNSGEIGHNNREGMVYEFDVTFEKYKFKIGMDYVVADVVNPREEQSDLQYFVVTLETLYVEF